MRTISTKYCFAVRASVELAIGTKTKAAAIY